jgi:hypothetical protein
MSTGYLLLSSVPTTLIVNGDLVSDRLCLAHLTHIVFVLAMNSSGINIPGKRLPTICFYHTKLYPTQYSKKEREIMKMVSLLSSFLCAGYWGAG